MYYRSNAVLKCFFSVVLFLAVTLLGNAQIIKVVPKTPADIIIFYSTAPGAVASDGVSGSKNSPFAAAFLENFRKKEALLLLATDIASATNKLTNGSQQPVFEVAVYNNKKYSLADKGKKKYALLIGNSNYQSSQANIANPVNDVQDIAKALQQLGYEVEVKTDANQSEMTAAVNAFTSKLRSEKESEGFFWYAGNGGMVNGVHCLLPVDVDVSSATDMLNTSYSLTSLLTGLQSPGNKINVAFIDTDRVTLLSDSGR
jgi:hypothetical protein